MATATFWQRGETIDRINDTAKTIPANTIQAIGTACGVITPEHTQQAQTRKTSGLQSAACSAGREITSFRHTSTR